MPQLRPLFVSLIVALVALAWRPATAQNTYDGAGNLNVRLGSGAGTGVPGGVTLVPTAGTPNEAAVSCGATTTTLLAAGAATQFWQIKVPAGGQAVWINIAGVAAVTAPPSIDLAAGSSIYYPVAGYLPNALISCIVAAGSQSVAVVSK